MNFRPYIVSLSICIIISAASAQSVLYNKRVQELCDKVDEQNITHQLESLCWADGYQSRITFTPGNYYSAEYIAQYFESLPRISKVVRDTFYLSVATYPYNGYPIVNISAYLEGSEPDSGYILLGAHYDASGSHEGDWESNWQNLKAQGADDNATGVAGIMEIARVLSDPTNAFENKTGIKFIAFGAEEYHPTHSNFHHIGSLYDAQKAQNNGDNLKAAIILDMFGYNPLKDYVELISDNPSLWLADKVYDSINLYVPFLETNTTPADVPYSDHDSYQQYGFPAILIMENDRPWNNQLPDYQANPYYHSEGDSVSTLNVTLVTKVIKSTLATLAHLSGYSNITSITDLNINKYTNLISVVIYPNPSNAQTTFNLDLVQSQRLTIDIFNSLGQKIVSLANDELYKEGQNYIVWKSNTSASGLYFIDIRGNSYNQKFKFVIIK